MVVRGNNFIVRVIELCAHSLDLVSCVLVSYVLVFVDTIEVNRIEVSELPLLLFTDPINLRVVQLLMVLNIGNFSIIIDQFWIFTLNFSRLIYVLKIFFHVFVGVD